MRIAIVNDMQMAVEILRRIVLSAPGHEIAWIAMDGEEAVQRCREDLPDLILMDLIMPVMDGVEATRRIMKETPCAILLVTAAVDRNISQVFDAMGFGALDAVNTPVLGTSGEALGLQALLTKISTIAKLIGKQPASSRVTQKIQWKALSANPPLLAIGASTGGPSAIAKILSALPEKFPVALVIVQHVDQQFTAGLVSWLKDQTALSVALAKEGDRPEVGKALIASTNDHLILTPSFSLSYTPHPEDFPYRPSVDVFFKSVAANCPEKYAAVLLTGMGRDGAEGMMELRRIGWHTIAQDKETSVVYGMPKAAAEMGAATEILPLERIAPSVINLYQKAGIGIVKT